MTPEVFYKALEDFDIHLNDFQKEHPDENYLSTIRYHHY